ncbi:MAG: MlaC/ttg2D family ABC transporter substrate-binding protein [Gammaproteobacteria bacterium]
MKRLWGVLFATMLAFAASGVIAAGDPTVVVQSTTDQVLSRISADKADLEANPQKMFNLVSELVFPHFDFGIMSQWVLGEHWSNADEATRGDFVNQFRKLLVRTYASALLNFSNQEITYPPVEQKAGGKTAVVRQEISQAGSTPIPIVYRLHSKTGDWKVFDVSVDGVSLVKTYRASFGSMIRDGGLDGLIASLNEKNAALGN